MLSNDIIRYIFCFLYRAIQILKILGELDTFKEKEKVVEFVSGLQNPDGSFRSYPEEDPGETDTRYTFCSVATLTLLNKLDTINGDKAAEYVVKCQNFDGAFGVREGSESHAGQVFCCVGALKLLGRLNQIDSDLLSWWLADRQVRAF